MRRALLVMLAGALGLLAGEGSPSGTRITPPTLREVSPLGVPRGGTVEIAITGYNLARASAIYFDEPSIKSRITRIRELADQDDVRLGGNGTPLTVDLGPLPARNEVTAELDIPLQAPIGLVRFRVLTPLGLSPEGTLSIEPFYGETADREPNDTAETAVLTELPTALVGTISKPGDVDYFQLKARAGEQVVFEDTARMLGSALQPVITISDENANVLRSFNAKDAAAFGYRFEKAGTYFVKVSDYEESGSGRHFYRILMGTMPVTLSAFPLGLERGKTAEISFSGLNLPARGATVRGEPNDGETDAMWVRPQGATGPSFTRVRLAVGKEREMAAQSTTAAQPVAPPVTINGRMTEEHHDFRFHARKGQKLVFEVNAARLGSPLDSQLEILDAKEQPVEQATVRAILQTSLALRDEASSDVGVRLDSQAGLQAGDLLMIGTEIVQVDAMPKGPDDDFLLTNFGGQRVTLLDTTAEAHAVDTPAYKVQVHPAGAKFAPNGLPLTHLMYRNDDGGAGFGKDSRLHFKAPADGDYVVRLRDVRGLKGPEYGYRLTIREPAPDYRLSVTPRNPNVPAGGRIPLTVTALRLDDFDGAIPVSVKGLPAGLHATDGVIAPGQKSTTLTLSADADAKMDGACALDVEDGKGRKASAEDRLMLIALMPRADVAVESATREVTLAPGGRATIEVTVNRENGFAGRVPLNVRNVPPTVRVIDIGLNGVLVNENETRRTFTLEALPGAEPIDQTVYVSGDVETRAAQQNSFLTGPITLRIRKSGKPEVSSQ